MKDKIHVLFVCGYGLGSSAVAEMLVKKGLVAEGINAEVKHTAVGELNSLWIGLMWWQSPKSWQKD